MEDSLRHKGLRKKLVDGLKLKGIRDQKVLEAIGKVPRHLFMESSFINFAYKDQAFPIGAGQTISQPYTVAFQTQLLGVEKHDKVLEVGDRFRLPGCCAFRAPGQCFSPLKGRGHCTCQCSICCPAWAYFPKFFFWGWL